VEESLTGRYLIVLYDGLPYPGEVIYMYVDEDDVEVKVFNFINIIYKLLFSKLKKCTEYVYLPILNFITGTSNMNY